MGQCFSSEEAEWRERYGSESVRASKGMPGVLRARLKLRRMKKQTQHDVVAAAKAQLFMKLSRSATIRDVSGNGVQLALTDLYTLSSAGINISRTDLSLASTWESLPGISRCSQITGQESGLSWSSSNLPFSTQGSQSLGNSGQVLSCTGSVVAGTGSLKKSITSLYQVAEVEDCCQRSTCSTGDVPSSSLQPLGQPADPSARSSRSRTYLDLVNGNTAIPASSSAAHITHTSVRQYWSQRQALASQVRTSLNLPPGSVRTAHCGAPRRTASMPRIAVPPDFNTIASPPATGLSRFFRGESSNLRTSAQKLMHHRTCNCAEECAVATPPPMGGSDPCAVSVRTPPVCRISSFGQCDALRRATSSSLSTSHDMYKVDLSCTRIPTFAHHELLEPTSDPIGTSLITAQGERLSSMVQKGTLQGSALAITCGVSLLPALLKEAASASDFPALQQAPPPPPPLECDDVERPSNGPRSSRFNPVANAKRDMLAGSSSSSSGVCAASRTAPPSCGGCSAPVLDTCQGQAGLEQPVNTNLLAEEGPPSLLHIPRSKVAEDVCDGSELDAASGVPALNQGPDAVSSASRLLAAVNRGKRHSPFSSSAGLSFVLQPNGLMPLTANGSQSGQHFQPAQHRQPAVHQISPHSSQSELLHDAWSAGDATSVTHVQTGCMRLEAEAALRLACVLKSKMRLDRDREGCEARNSAGRTPLRRSTLGHDSMQHIVQGGAFDDANSMCTSGMQALRQQQQDRYVTQPEDIHSGGWDMVHNQSPACGSPAPHTAMPSALVQSRLGDSSPQAPQLTDTCAAAEKGNELQADDGKKRASPFAVVRPSSTFMLDGQFGLFTVNDDNAVSVRNVSRLVDSQQLALEQGYESTPTDATLNVHSLPCPSSKPMHVSGTAFDSSQPQKAHAPPRPGIWQHVSMSQDGCGSVSDECGSAGHVSCPGTSDDDDGHHHSSILLSTCHTGPCLDDSVNDGSDENDDGSNSHAESSVGRDMGSKQVSCSQLLTCNTGLRSQAGQPGAFIASSATRRASVDAHRRGSSSLMQTLQTVSGMFAVMNQNLDNAEQAEVNTCERLPSDFIESCHSQSHSDNCSSEYLSDSVFKYDMAMTRDTPADTCGPAIVMPVRAKKGFAK